MDSPEDRVPCEDFASCGVAQFQNRQYKKNAKQQDAYFVVEDIGATFGVHLGLTQPVALYGVADGHGEFGEVSANFICRNLPSQLAQSPHFAAGRLGDAILAAFTQTELLQQAAGLPLWASGSCVSAVAVSATHIVVGNCGDCRCVLAENGAAVNLSNDHNVENAAPEELQRILNSGATITPDKRVTLPGAPGRLATTRSMGDYWAKPQGPPERHVVSALPEIRTIARQPGQQFLILASDGIFGFMSSQDAVTLCLKAAQEPQGMKPLSRLAHSVLWKSVNARRSDDNCTCLVIDLSQVGVVAPPAPNRSGMAPLPCVQACQEPWPSCCPAPENGRVPAPVPVHPRAACCGGHANGLRSVSPDQRARTGGGCMNSHVRVLGGAQNGSPMWDRGPSDIYANGRCPPCPGQKAHPRGQADGYINGHHQIPGRPRRPPPALPGTRTHPLLKYGVNGHQLVTREDSDSGSLSSLVAPDEVCWCPWCWGMNEEGDAENVVLGSFERWRLHMHDQHFDKLTGAYGPDEIVPCYWCCRPCVTKKGQSKNTNLLPFWGSHERVCRENPNKPVLLGQARSSGSSQSSSGDPRRTAPAPDPPRRAGVRDLMDSRDLRDLTPDADRGTGHGWAARRNGAGRHHDDGPPSPPTTNPVLHAAAAWSRNDTIPQVPQAQTRPRRAL